MVRATAQREVRSSQPLQVDFYETGSDADFYVKDRYKRFFDLIVIIAAHILLLPLALLFWTAIPLAIWVEDRGPIFYTQRRVGRNGRIFRLYKFRSMVRNAEALTGPVWASEEDSRVTRVGRFLRTRALDELPQIINILKGDMSLVGPRPERPELVDQFSRDIPRFLERLHATPGLTGIAQVYGRYSAKPRVKLLYDMLYVKNMSPWVDVKILFMSLFVSLHARWQANDRKLRSLRKAASHTPARAKATRPQ